ncbi:MAG: DUF6020 family protein [Candidatus Limiplasma sp.]|nr:DUF6020 family protein [Candidatus Limiplasma sp.]
MPQTHTVRNGVLAALLWALSLAAFCLPLAAPVPDAAQTGVAWTRTLPATGAWFALAVALGLGYASLARRERAFSNIRLWVLAVLFAAVATLGESFAQTGTAALATARPGITFVYFAGRACAYYAGMALLVQALAAPAAEPPLAFAADAPTPYPTASGGVAPQPAPWQPEAAGYGAPYAAAASDTRAAAALQAAQAYPAYRPRESAPAVRMGPPAWGYALLLVLCWLPYLITVWPGTVSNDSITQLAEIFGRKALSNGNPLFQTGLVWLAVQAGQTLLGSADAAVACYVCVQGALLACLLGFTLKRLEETRMPLWLRALATAFYALCPIFPTFAFCMGKDTAFAMAVLWFSLMVWRVVRSKWPPMRTTVGLCLSAALCALLRNAGAAVAALTLLALLGFAMGTHTRRWRAPLLALLTMGATLALLYGVAIPRLQAAPTPATENWSIPLQQVARTVASEALTPEERAAIDPVLPVDELKAAYEGELSDPVKDLWRGDADAAAQSAFFQAWLRLGLKHPATYLSATFHNGYGYLLPGFISTIKPTFLLGMEGRTTLIDGAFDFTVNPNADALKKTFQSLYAAAPFRLLVGPGAYGWITLFAFTAIFIGRRWRNAIAALPALLTLLGCLVSAVNGYFRYALPLYCMAPALLAMAAQSLRPPRPGGGR